MLFYESIAHSFDSVVNMYDARKRVSVIFSELLPPDITGKQLLDAGCGMWGVAVCVCFAFPWRKVPIHGPGRACHAGKIAFGQYGLRRWL